MDTERDELFFPLAASDAVGLGVDFVLARGAQGGAGPWGLLGSGWADTPLLEWEWIDRTAVTRLNAVRTEALTQLRSKLADAAADYQRPNGP